MRPAAQLPSFGRRSGAPPPDGRPKEPGARKGGPTVRAYAGRDPSLRYGQPPVLNRAATLRNSLCSLRSRRSDIRSKLVHEARASCSALARPSLCAPRHGQRGGTPTRAIASLGPTRISRKRRSRTPSPPPGRGPQIKRPRSRPFVSSRGAGFARPLVASPLRGRPARGRRAATQGGFVIQGI
ncbi:hypothetical protein ABIE13_002958 [Ottowia thiooxydans]|uniref:Uncharacterized protein n=1 Tax=Ottowia thiooxydans TaxID=219182 RepID=A0ABV2QA06_9BURK